MLLGRSEDEDLLTSRAGLARLPLATTLSRMWRSLLLGGLLVTLPGCFFLGGGRQYQVQPGGDDAHSAGIVTATSLRMDDQRIRLSMVVTNTAPGPLRIGVSKVRLLDVNGVPIDSARFAACRVDGQVPLLLPQGASCRIEADFLTPDVDDELPASMRWILVESDGFSRLDSLPVVLRVPMVVTDD